MCDKKLTHSSKHSNGYPESLRSTTDRATPILALKALRIGSSPNISSGDTWNASGTIPEPFRKIHQNWIPEPFRNHSGKFTKIIFRKRYGIHMDTPSSVRLIHGQRHVSYLFNPHKRRLCYINSDYY